MTASSAVGCSRTLISILSVGRLYSSKHFEQQFDSLLETAGSRHLETSTCSAPSCSITCLATSGIERRALSILPMSHLHAGPRMISIGRWLRHLPHMEREGPIEIRPSSHPGTLASGRVLPLQASFRPDPLAGSTMPCKSWRVLLTWPSSRCPGWS